MNSAHIEELAVPYDPSRAEERVAQRRRLFRGRLLSLGITVAIMTGLYLWQRAQFTGVGWIVVYAVALLISLGWVAGSWLAYRRAVSELAEVRPGIAVRVDRQGVTVAGASAAWAEVDRLAMVGGGLGRSPRLLLTRSSGPPASVAIDQVAVLPATLDSTVRAYSAGRHGVDFSALDT